MASMAIEIKVSEEDLLIELNHELKNIQFTINNWHWTLQRRGGKDIEALDKIKMLEEKRVETIREIQKYI